jgi:hypothetical protein
MDVDKKTAIIVIIVISVFVTFFLFLVGCLGLGALMFEYFNADDDVPAVSTS